MAAASPTRRTTRTRCTVGVSVRAWSTLRLSGTIVPWRNPPSAVMTTFACASLIRSRSDSAENPPKTTVCTAPIRAHASIAIGSSGIMGR